MSEISIIDASPERLKEYTRFLQPCYVGAYVSNELGLTEDCFSTEVFNTPDTQQYLRSHLVNSEAQKTYLAIANVGDNEQLIGCITVERLDEETGEIKGFYVAPNLQGTGLGTKLYETALNFLGPRAIVLDTYCHNENPIEIYKHWGFELDTARGEDGYFYRHWPEWPDDLQAKCLYMRKPGS